MTGGFFCTVFFISLVIYSAGTCRWSDNWTTEDPMVVTANISGVSFATAITVLFGWGIIMLIGKINFKTIRHIFHSEAMNRGKEIGKEMLSNEIQEAVDQRPPGVSYQEAVEQVLAKTKP